MLSKNGEIVAELRNFYISFGLRSRPEVVYFVLESGKFSQKLAKFKEKVVKNER